MIHGDLSDIDESAKTSVFVFNGLVARLRRPRIAGAAEKLHRWEVFVDCWDFDQLVCGYMARLAVHYKAPTVVLAWEAFDFKKTLIDKLWSMHVPIEDVWCMDYEVASIAIATDPAILNVYDPEKAHRYGYGFKCRDFDLEVHR